MPDPASLLARLMDAPMRPGVVQWLGVRPARRAALVPADRFMLDPAHGVAGDHYAGTRGTRHVTLIGAADLAAIASHLGLHAVEPGTLRRNVVVAGLNLAALKGRRLRLGTALLEVTGDCHPCSRMEAAFGPGGYNAVRGHGGLTARVLEAGLVAVGDAVARV